MPKALPHKRQHWIPRSYLNAWCDPATPKGHQPYVWRFEKDGTSRARKSPKNIFHATDLYTIHLSDGTRELSIEHGLSGLESEFVRIRDDVLAKENTVSENDRFLLCAFVAAMKARSRSQLQHLQGQFQQVFDHMTHFKEMMEARPLHERAASARRVPRSSPHGDKRAGDYENMKAIAEGPMGPWVAELTNGQLPYLTRMSLIVLTTTSRMGFITSDRPCVWFDPESHKRPLNLRGAGLGFPSTEITLPASPKQMMLLSWSDLSGYCDVSATIVDEFNRRTRFHADEYFIVTREETKPIWFDEGRPSGDATDAVGE